MTTISQGIIEGKVLFKKCCANCTANTVLVHNTYLEPMDKIKNRQGIGKPIRSGPVDVIIR